VSHAPQEAPRLPTVSLAGTASYLPARVVTNDFFGDASTPRSAMFRGAKTRHHVAEGESAASMLEQATRTLCTRLGVDPAREIDLILTNVSVPDMPMLGSGAALARLLGASPRQIVDVHNCGCVSFVFMMQLGRALMAASGARTALLGNVQNAGGRIFAHPANRAKHQSAVPGDGCGVGLLVASEESPIRSIVVRAFPEYADDMRAISEDGRAWWEPRATPMHIDFTESRMASIVTRGNRLVPDVVRAACADASIAPRDIGLLVTNQPSPIFLRNWREALSVPAEAHVDTFAEHGNLFGAALPIAFERAERQGKLRPGTKVVFGGFSHAGDYAAAAVVDWRSGAAG
jgi:3-oxoacyl-[acyl-carrier-protein] synthase-3